ncbi:hypothetical protein F4780DRAFT_465885 [Xylariomycetidae sp. FL0641]|nr:hypothetical protein F4780DRAFT_465885 [Xylariomycetidae sp. FL0641]
MASQLPTFPRILFTIIEPISLIAGALGPLFDADWFIASQIDQPGPIVSSDNARLVALQLGNTYGLVFLLGIAVLYTTTELRVVRNYIIACWLADITHVGMTCWGLGYARTVDVASWNAVTWGNVGFTAFLCLIRTLYLVGFFGSGNQTVVNSKKKA